MFKTIILLLSMLDLMLALSGFNQAYANAISRSLGEAAMRQAVVSTVQNEIEGPRGTTINVNNSSPQAYQTRSQTWYDGPMTNGGSYRAQIVNQKPHGQRTMTSPDGTKYVGAWKGGKPHGQGTMTSPDGKKYVGVWEGGKPYGHGTMTSPDGTKYVGAWKGGKRYGHGTMTSPDGTKYVGVWKDGKKYGQGTMTSPDGTKYVGAWKGGKRYGHGTMTSPDGTKYVGVWKDNETLRGTATLSNGLIISGEWGTINKGTIHYLDGRLYEGAWDGSPQPEAIKVGTWAVERPHGVGKMTYPDGRIQQGLWRQGEFVKKRN